MFQGATARNKALVGRSTLLDVEVVVSPYSTSWALRCGPAGPSGDGGEEAAQMSFHRLDLESRKVTLRKENCVLFQNDCSITYAEIEGVEGAPSWGYMCGRDPAEQKVRKSPHDACCGFASASGARPARA